MTAAARVNAVLVAPGASAAESALCYLTGAAGAGAVALGAHRAGVGVLAVVVLAVVAFDLIGGAVVNATAAAKLRFHAPPPLRRPLAFAITALGTVVALLAAPAPAFLTWVTPVLLVKLLLGHLLPEEPR